MKKIRIMGILNRTPDSHYDGGLYTRLEDAVVRGVRIEQDGADFIDVGGESTRPGATPIDLNEEMKRVLPLVSALVKEVQIPISIDTSHWQVAEKALKLGARCINDISGCSSEGMIAVAKDAGVPVCVMHMQGTPQTMQKKPTYPKGIVPFLIDWFDRKISHLIRSGIRESQLILDPGIGFGKTVDDNYKIIDNLHEIKKFGYPILIGLSRKSLLYKVTGQTPQDVLPATLALNAIAAEKGADILRVYDVAAHRQVSKVIEKLLNQEALCPFSSC